MRTLLGDGRPSAWRDQLRPVSPDTYRLPFRSASATAEPCVAMQPVSTMPSIHCGQAAGDGDQRTVSIDRSSVDRALRREVV